MRLRLQAERMDWDAALAELDVDAVDAGAPESVDDEDVETTRFNELHGLLHVAVQAVLDASGDEISYLE
jgi:hypothetical protein